MRRVLSRGTCVLSLAGALGLLLFSGVAQASSVHGFRYELSGYEAGEPPSKHSFSEPCGAAVDSHGNVYVAQGSEVDVLRPTGDFVTKIVDGHNPCSLAIDSTGKLYVTELWEGASSDNKVVMYAPSSFPPNGKTSYGAPKTIAEFEGSELRAVAVDPSNDHAFVNEKSHVNEYKSTVEGSGLLSNTIGSGTLGTSFGLAVDGSNSDVYATETLAGAVYGFDAPTYSTSETCKGTGAKEGAFTAGFLQNIAIDQEDGDLFVFDAKHGVVDEFHSGCEFVVHIGPKFGNGSISLKETANVVIAVDNGEFSPSKGNVYVAGGSAAKARLFAFGPLEDPRPEAVTGAATELTPTSATLNGTVNPNGIELEDCHFEYVTEAAFEASEFATATSVSCGETPAAIGSGAEPVAVHVHLPVIASGAYRFRLSAENENPPADVGKVAAFGPPEIATEAALPVFYTEATINAKINPEGLVTTYEVEYGTAEGEYQQSSPALELPVGLESVPVQVVLTGLQPNTPYHYRIVAVSEGGMTTGPDQTLRTLPEPPVELCPNAQFRSGPSAALPDCRAYELVSPPNMGAIGPTWPPGDAVDGNFDFALVAASGASAVFMTEGTLPGSNGNGVRDAHRALRGPDGWTSSLFSPTGAQTDGVGAGGISPDQLYSFWTATGINGSLDPDAGVAAHYIHRPGGVIDPECSPEPDGDFELIGCGSLDVDPEAQGRWITGGGDHTIFTTSAGCGVCTTAKQLELDAPPKGTGAIYDRTPDGVTHVVSLLPDESTPASEASYRGVSADGSAVAFTLEEEGTTTLYERRHNDQTLEVASGSTTYAGLSEHGDSLFYAKGGALYAFDASSPKTTQIAAGGEADFVNVSIDGSHVYFTSTEVLDEAEEGVEGEDNLYVWDDGDEAIDLVATLAHSDLVEFGGSTNVSLVMWAAGLSPEANGTGSGPAVDPSRTTPDGRFLIFESHANLGDYDSDGHAEIYRYAATGGTLTCISCSPTDAPAKADALLHPFEIAGAPIRGLSRIQNVTDDGRAVFFQSADTLLPADHNEAQDVYEWREGRLSLISSGQGAANSFLYAMTPDGRDVLFTTRDALLAPDEEGGGFTLYDARVEGGFPSPEESASCQGEACQGGPSAAPALSIPASSALQDSGEAKPRAGCPKGRRKVRRAGKARCVGHHPKKHHPHRAHKPNDRNGRTVR